MGVTAIIGLAADAITIFDKIQHRSSQAEPSSSAGVTLFIFLMSYGWFILSWLIVKWKHSRQGLLLGSRRKLKLAESSGATVFTLGVLLFPFPAYLGYLFGTKGNPDDFLGSAAGGILASGYAMGVVGLLVWLAIWQGMPLIYDDIS